jgi:NAD(P)-dependent dehydrogenase (short-subunit alcohol dehydrogenase family)
MNSERSIAGANMVFFGGSTGIGRAAALELGRRGAAILIVGRGREAGEAAAASVKAAGATSGEFLSGDLSTIAGVAAVVFQIHTRYASIGIYAYSGGCQALARAACDHRRIMCWVNQDQSYVRSVDAPHHEADGCFRSAT